MAKKRVSPAPAASQESHRQPMPPAEEMENLKTLNNILLKETSEAREQIKRLKSQLDDLPLQQPMLSDIELTVGHLFHSYRAKGRINRSEAGEEIQAGEVSQNEADLTAEDRLRAVDEQIRLVAAAMEKSEAEGRHVISKLENLCECLASDKAAMNNSLKDAAEVNDLLCRSLEDAKRDLEHLKMEKDEGVRDFNRISYERNETLKDLEIQEGLVRVLEVKVRELEKSVMEKAEALVCAHTECHRLEEGLKDWEKVVKSLDAENVSLVRAFDESNHSITILKKEMKEALRCKDEALERVETELWAKISSVEQDKEVLARENGELRAGLSSCRVKLASQEQIERDLRSVAIEDEERLYGLKQLQAELEALLEEKGKIISSLELMQAKLAAQVDDLGRKLAENECDKEAILIAKAAQDTVVLELQQEVARLHSAILALQDSRKDMAAENEKLRVYRDTIQNALVLQRKETEDLTLQVAELHKIKDCNERKIGQLEMEYERVVEDVKEKDGHIHILVEDKNSIQRSLVAAEEDLEDMKRKWETAQMLSERALSLLKSTAQMVGDLELKENGKKDGSELRSEIEMKGEVELDQEFQSFVVELETIKMGFRSGRGKMEDMMQQLKLLQETVTEAQKKKGLWAWLSSAAAIVAAVSVAYAVRGP